MAISYRAMMRSRTISEFEECEKMNPGEKYLTVSLFGGKIKINCFKNDKHAKDTDPLYYGNGVAVFINTVKEKLPEIKEQPVEELL